MKTGFSLRRVGLAAAVGCAVALPFSIRNAAAAQASSDARTFSVGDLKFGMSPTEATAAINSMGSGYTISKLVGPHTDGKGTFQAGLIARKADQSDTIVVLFTEMKGQAFEIERRLNFPQNHMMGSSINDAVKQKFGVAMHADPNWGNWDVAQFYNAATGAPIAAPAPCVQLYTIAIPGGDSPWTQMNPACGIALRIHAQAQTTGQTTWMLWLSEVLVNNQAFADDHNVAVAQARKEQQAAEKAAIKAATGKKPSL